MNIRRTLLRRIVQYRVDEPNNGLTVLVKIGLDTGVVDFAGFYFVQDAIDRQLEAVILFDTGDDV